MAETLAVGDRVDVAAVLSENAWNGRTTIEFQAWPCARGSASASATPAGGRRRDGAGARGPGDGPAVRVDPGAADPLAELRLALRGDGAVRLALTPSDLAALEAEANAWPTVTDVRTAWVARARGGRRRWRAARRARRRRPADLGLLDADGRVVKGRKVEPYASPLLRAGLVRRYALLTLAEAYRRLDDDGFEHAVLALADLPPD
jgi:hypothetical protein